MRSPSIDGLLLFVHLLVCTRSRGVSMLIGSQGLLPRLDKLAFNRTLTL